MSDRDHMAGIKAAVVAFDRLCEKQSDLRPLSKKADSSEMIQITGVSLERVVETIVAAYLAGSHS